MIKNSPPSQRCYGSIIHGPVLTKQYLVDCDEVIFMREGSITEKGSHEDLMNLNGDYAAMFNNLQLGDTPFIEVRPTDILTYLSNLYLRDDNREHNCLSQY